MATMQEGRRLGGKERDREKERQREGEERLYSCYIRTVCIITPLPI